MFGDNRLSRWFWKSIEVTESGCWVKKTHTNIGGYTSFKVGDRPKMAHRHAYEVLIGPIPDGLQLDHLCRNPACVNPNHLEPVTSRENLLRSNGWGGVNARKTHCHKGHEFTPENTLIGRDGRRVCRACKRERKREERGSLPLPPPLPQRAHCKHGHPVTPDSLFRTTVGAWVCKECNRMHQKQYYRNRINQANGVST